MMHARRKECAAWHIHPLRIDHIPMNIPRNCTRSPTITGGPNGLRCCGTFNGICLCFNGIQRGMVQRPAKMVALGAQACKDGSALRRHVHRGRRQRRPEQRRGDRCLISRVLAVTGAKPFPSHSSQVVHEHPPTHPPRTHPPSLPLPAIDRWHALFAVGPWPLSRRAKVSETGTSPSVTAWSPKGDFSADGGHFRSDGTPRGTTPP